MKFANGGPGGLRHLRRPSNMEAQIEHPVEDNKSLRRCINDLVSVLALPAMWSEQEPAQIVSTQLDVLSGMLHLDFAYARLKDPFREAPIEIVRLPGSRNFTARPEEIGRMLNPRLSDEAEKWPLLVRNPVGDGILRSCPCDWGCRAKSASSWQAPSQRISRGRPRDYS